MEFPHTHISGEDELGRIMHGFGFRPTSLAEISPVIAALKLDHHLPVVANYKMSLAGVDIAYACMTLPQIGRPMELITLLNTPGNTPQFFKINAQELLHETHPMTKPFTPIVAKKSDVQPDLFTVLPREATLKLRHFEA